MQHVPFVDLRSLHEGILSDLSDGLSTLVQESNFILGKPVEVFEHSWASYIGVPFAMGVANGTDALELAFTALDLGEQDEVIIPAHTFVATAVAVKRCGATPVLVDVELDSSLMNTSLIEKAISKRTKGICPVHLYGRVCDMHAIQSIAAQHGLWIVEDSAQAHGAFGYNGKAGSYGALGCFSFYPGKNLGAVGDAGIVVTQSADLAERVRRIRNYGSRERYRYEEFGWNSRLDTLQALFLDHKLPKLDHWNGQRWLAAQRYHSLLGGVSDRIVLPELQTPEQHVFHIYQIRTSKRDLVRTYLQEHGIETGIHYPHPYFLQPAFRELGHVPGDFPNAEMIAKETLSLPLYPTISIEQQEYVALWLERALCEFGIGRGDVKR